MIVSLHNESNCLRVHSVICSERCFCVLTSIKIRTSDTFHVVFCKVIRIGKRVQPDISKARQQVNIDRPAYNKTDKQCRTRTTITARLPDD